MTKLQCDKIRALWKEYITAILYTQKSKCKKILNKIKKIEEGVI